jgi:hypothetical protein
MIYIDSITGPCGNYEFYVTTGTVYRQYTELGIYYITPGEYLNDYAGTDEADEYTLMADVHVIHCVINNQLESEHIVGASADLLEAMRYALINTRIIIVNESDECHVLLKTVLESDKESFIFEIKEELNTRFIQVDDYTDLELELDILCQD